MFQECKKNFKNLQYSAPSSKNKLMTKNVNGKSKLHMINKKQLRNQ